MSVSFRPMPRLVLAAAASDSGKTTIAIGLVAALRRRPLAVAAAKCGPDFIDAAHLTHASGRTARNLDAFLGSEDAVVRSLERGTRGAEIAIVEGVMGLFDGRHGSGAGSTAHVARITGSPVVLVLDCAKASATIGAIAYGLARFDARLNVAGAILNRVASDKHAATLTDACRSAGVPVLGIVRRDERLSIPSRHLGLTAPGEAGWQEMVEAAATVVERDVDLDAVLALAATAPPLPLWQDPARSAEPDVRVAIARDDAFWFYDEASLDALRDAGAELVPFSPLHDAFPEVDAAFIGGGYPEMHAAALERNVACRAGLQAAIAAGLPAYAECGGLMYLGRALESGEDRFAMTGAVPAISTMSAKRAALRYVEARVLAEDSLFSHGEIVRGHEFHYSQTRYEDAEAAPAFEIEGAPEGFAAGAVHASYVHVHLGSYPRAVNHFLSRARAFSGRAGVLR